MQAACRQGGVCSADLPPYPLYYPLPPHNFRTKEGKLSAKTLPVNDWIGDFATNSIFAKAPDSQQHFDQWSFQTADNEGGYFGKMPSQIVENLLWLLTEPGDIVFDPFAGSGTTIDVAKQMGRRYSRRKNTHGGDRRSEQISRDQIDPLKTADKLANEHGVSTLSCRG